MGMDGTFTGTGSNPRYSLPAIPFPRRIVFHTPVVFIPPTSDEKFLLEVSATRAGDGPPICGMQGCTARRQLLPLHPHCPSPASHKSPFALCFSAVVALSPKEPIKPAPCGIRCWCPSTGSSVVTPARDRSHASDAGAESFAPAD